MNYVDRAGTTPKSAIYFTTEENDKCVEILREWVPRRREAMAKNNLHLAPIPEFIGASVLKICTHIASRYNYNDYPFKSEMISDAVLNIMRYIHSFDPDKIGERSQRINFYSWVTKSADRCFGGRIRLEKRQDYYRYAIFEEMGGFAAFGDDPDAMGEGTSMTSEMAQDFVSRAREYELKQEKEKENIKKKELEKNGIPEEKPSILRFIK